MPKLSVITINYNNAAGLQKTMQSVFEQTFTDFEYIIIDGGSSDGSKKLIESHAGKLSYWISEKDNGIYNAMNKGIKKATSSYILFLNSGDFLYSASALKTLCSHKDADIIYGDILWEVDSKTEPGFFPDKLPFNYFIGNSLPHQATLIKKSLFDEIGLYDESQRIISDWIFFIVAICKHNYSYKHIPEVISVCERNGISCDLNNYEEIAADRKQILNKYFPAFLNDYEISRQQGKEIERIKRMLGYRIHSRIKKIITSTKFLKNIF